MNKRILKTGIVLFVVGILAQTLFAFLEETNSGSDPFGFLGFAAGLLTFAGLIVIIVGAVRSDGTGQQQQQQVVVYTGGPTAPSESAAASVRCPTCSSLNEPDARFCLECGHAIPAARTGGPRRARPGGRAKSSR